MVDRLSLDFIPALMKKDVAACLSVITSLSMRQNQPKRKSWRGNLGLSAKSKWQTHTMNLMPTRSEGAEHWKLNALYDLLMPMPCLPSVKNDPRPHLVPGYQAAHGQGDIN